MAILLFSLRGVPEDEAFEVRELLSSQHIDFYETSAGNWGISMPALWLRTDAQLRQAQQLLADYQQQRQITQRQLYLQRKQAGQQKTMAHVFKEKPWLVSSYFIALFLTFYVSIKLLFEFGLTSL
jgi:hypothetical protein